MQVVFEKWVLIQIDMLSEDLYIRPVGRCVEWVVTVVSLDPL